MRRQPHTYDEDDSGPISTEEQQRIIHEISKKHKKNDKLFRTTLLAILCLFLFARITSIAFQLIRPWKLPVYKTYKHYRSKTFVATVDVISILCVLSLVPFVRRHSRWLNWLLVVSVLTTTALIYFWSKKWRGDYLSLFWFFGGNYLMAFCCWFVDSSIVSATKQLNSLNDLVYNFKTI